MRRAPSPRPGGGTKRSRTPCRRRRQTINAGPGGKSGSAVAMPPATSSGSGSNDQRRATRRTRRRRRALRRTSAEVSDIDDDVAESRRGPAPRSARRSAACRRLRATAWASCPTADASARPGRPRGSSLRWVPRAVVMARRAPSGCAAVDLVEQRAKRIAARRSARRPGAGSASTRGMSSRYAALPSR